MEAASSDEVGLVSILDGFGRGLDTDCCFVPWVGKEVASQICLPSCEKKSSIGALELGVVLVEDQLLTGAISIDVWAAARNSYTWSVWNQKQAYIKTE